jgi:hypothetical protein
MFNQKLFVMKNLRYLLLISAIILSASVILSGCKKKDETPVQKVNGTISFPAGVSGDLSNTKVSLYLSYTEWQNNSPVSFVRTSGGGASATYEFSSINTGNYYMDAWKDIDNSGTWSVGDYIGWYGSGGLGAPALTPFQVASGQTFTANMSMYIIAKDFKFVRIK